jgi:hypothetical protein
MLLRLRQIKRKRWCRKAQLSAKSGFDLGLCCIPHAFHDTLHLPSSIINTDSGVVDALKILMHLSTIWCQSLARTRRAPFRLGRDIGHFGKLRHWIPWT